MTKEELIWEIMLREKAEAEAERLKNGIAESILLFRDEPNALTSSARMFENLKELLK